MGIKTTGAGQVVYLDTPGIHRSSGRALNRYMNRVAKAAFRDVDLVLFMIEAGRWSRNDQAILKTLRAANLPILLVINKVDLAPHVGADVERMISDATERRDGPVVATSVRSPGGIEPIANWVRREVLDWTLSGDSSPGGR